VPDDIVFTNPNKGSPWSSTNSVRDHWVDVLKKAGVRYRTPCQTRNAYASQMLNAGEDLEYIAQQIGHSDISVSLKYYARFIKNTEVKYEAKLEAAHKAFKTK